jgi:type I restriction enzyme S subunit
VSKLATRKKLGELCSVVTKGTTPTSLGMKFEDEGVPFLRIQNLSGSSVHLKDILYISEDTHNALNRSKIMPGDFLITIAGTIGRVAIVPDDFPEANCNQAVAILRFDKSKLLPRYLLHWLTTNDALRQISGKKVTATISNLSLGQIKELEIPLPPLDEQKRSAAILDKADAIRRKRQQAINLADDFLRSVFLDMFGDPITNPKGWEVKPLVSLCKKITDGTHHSPPIVKNGVPYVTAKHLKKSGLEFHNKPWYVSEEAHQGIYSRCNPELNDVLYIKDGATTGLAAINEYDFEFSMLSSLALLKPNYEKVTSEFLCMFLNHPRTKLVLTANMAGAAITRLTLTKIKDVKVPLPDLASQKRFSKIYISVRSFLNKINCSSDLSNQEFNSLSQKAFSGEL